MLSVRILGLLLTIASATATGQKHHKVRHKHNALNLRGNHVNEIREALDEYRSVIHRAQDDEDLVRPARPTHSSEYFSRSKRVFPTRRLPTSSTAKFNENYDEEYNDEDDNDTNRRLADDAHAGSARLSRDSADDQGGLTEYKLKMLGTREGVDDAFAREQQNKAQDVHHLIQENMRRTKIDGMCRWPNKRVIEMPQHASKMYTPRKYVIYQCSDDTACCVSDDKTCVAKKSEQLVIWFHVRLFSQEGPTGVESLRVTNHTECECIYKNRPATRGTRAPYVWPTAKTTTTAPACKCPTFFEAQIDEDGECGCVCKKSECEQRFEGNESFSLTDRRCISNDECKAPHCQHGIYKRASGRCPDRNEKMSKVFTRQSRW